MALDQDLVIDEVQVIVGDLAEQFQGSTAKLQIEEEIKSTIRWITNSNSFYWNQEEAEFSHTAGVISLPSYVARVSFIVDSNGNSNYYLASREQYSLAKRSSSHAVSYSSNSSIPFLISTDKTTGNDQIEICTFDNTASSLVYYITFTRTTDDITEAWIPERLYPLVVSLTAANFLVKLDNPDQELIEKHTNIARINLQIEQTLGKNKGIVNTNVNLRLSPNIGLDVGGDVRG